MDNHKEIHDEVFRINERNAQEQKPDAWLAIAIILSTVFYAFIIWVVLALISDNKRLIQQNEELKQDSANYIRFIEYQQKELDSLKDRVKYEKKWRSELNKKYPNQLPLPKLVMKG